MKAIILAGGYGTRLRPLTLSKPKSLVEFCNKPILFHQVEALAKAGVSDIVLAVCFWSDDLVKVIDGLQKKLNIKIHISMEDEPLGTAGPIALARQYLIDEEPFFVLNSDITCCFPFRELMKFHKEHGGQASIVVTQVDEPSKYGVVIHQHNGCVDKFLEKPSSFVSNKINAGIYVINQQVLEQLEVKPISIEKEVFPRLVINGDLYCYLLEGFWMDIGQPKDYLTGVKLYLKNLQENGSTQLDCRPNIVGSVIIHETAIINEDCKIGPNVVIGENVVIQKGVRLSNCVIMSGSIIKSNTFIDSSIIGWKCSVGYWCRIEGYSVFGENVMVKEELYINGAIILPHKSISNSLLQPEIII